MLFAFICRCCGVDLTDFLSEADGAVLDPSNISGAMIRPGQFVRIHASISKQNVYRITFAAAQEGAAVIVNPGDYIVNVTDLRHKMHPDAAFGCCGYQGGVEPNAQCPYGHAVATVHSDCWHAAFARLIGASVECVEA
jgi:hypothetical protein